MTIQEFNQLQDKEYIGDGVYVGHDGYHIWVTTQNGISVTNAVVLEPDVADAFGKWCIRIADKHENV